jgi:hypothetical protein
MLICNYFSLLDVAINYILNCTRYMYVQSIELYFLLNFSYFISSLFYTKNYHICNIITYLGHMGINTSNKLNC